MFSFSLSLYNAHYLQYDLPLHNKAYNQKYKYPSTHTTKSQLLTASFNRFKYQKKSLDPLIQDDNAAF